MNLSVILPTYNESQNIVQLVKEIGKFIPENVQAEIIVVDDNSPDNTYQVVAEKFKNDSSIRVFLRTQDRGLAKSIRYGIEQATGYWILVMDTDFTHNPLEIPKLLHVAQIYDLVTCSRFCPGGNMQDQYHYIASFVYNLFLRLVLKTQIQDNLGGFYVIKRKHVLQLPFDKIFFGYGEYYFRLLHFAQQYNFSIVEIPANYLNRSTGKSKSNFFKMIFTYTWAAILLKLKSKSDLR